MQLQATFLYNGLFWPPTPQPLRAAHIASPAQLRTTDLDALERAAATIAYGDINAEDPLHLSELSFVKVFRLAQALVEYLLFVQDSLQATNTALEQGRCAADGRALARVLA